jgi:hypothetical protein
MFTRLLCGVGAVVMCASLASAQSGPAGHWEGTFTAENRPMTLGLDLAQNAKSQWVASMSVPSEQATGLVVSDVVVSGASVKFVGVELMMARFDLTIGADGKMKGTMSNPQSTLPIEFTRTGEPNVELIPSSPAVSKELEGAWEGSLGMGGQALTILVHFKNQADGTVAATFANVSMGGAAVPLNDVRQTGQKVDFGLKVGHASFRGTLNKEGTAIEGQFTHEETSMPVTLRKK